MGEMVGFLHFLRSQTRLDVFYFLPFSTQMGFVASNGALFGFWENVGKCGKMLGFLHFLRNQTRMGVFFFLPFSIQMGFAASDGALFGF